MLSWLPSNSAVLGGSAPFDQNINTWWEPLKHTWEQMTWERQRERWRGRETGWQARMRAPWRSLLPLSVWRLSILGKMEDGSEIQFSSVQLYSFNFTSSQSCVSALHSVGSCSSDSRCLLRGEGSNQLVGTSPGFGKQKKLVKNN